MKQIPNIMTSANLFCGVLALVYISLGQIEAVIWLLGIALFFDFFDGFAARLLKANSPMGKELDSLADMVSFGVVPAFIMARMLREAEGQAFLPEAPFALFEETPYFLAGFLIAVFAALRLAKFNVDDRQSDSFHGLPTPANTILVLSYWMITAFNPESMAAGWLQNHWVLMGLCGLSCWLLVSDVKLIALKFKSFAWKENIFRYVLVLAALVLPILFQYQGIPLIILAYICLSLLQNAMNS